MFFFPVAFLIFIFFILLLPILFLLAYFNIVTLGFERLGISPQSTIIILFLMLFCSTINIPLTKKKIIYTTEARFFGLFQIPRLKTQYIAINLGGAIIPILLSFFLLYKTYKLGFNLYPILVSTFLMILICKSLAKISPGQGIALPSLIPAIFSAFFSLIFAPQFASSCAFISGVFGTLIGGDLLNLKKVQEISPGFISIGGAGVFDGIFLIGIISALLSGFP